MQLFSKTLQDLSWVSLAGLWENTKGGGLSFSGSEFSPTDKSSDSSSSKAVSDGGSQAKFVDVGNVIFSQSFREGRLRLQVEFEDVDYRSAAGIIIQYSLETQDMLAFVITGGGIPIKPGVAGFLFKLQSWGPRSEQLGRQQSTPVEYPKIWTSLFEAGLGSNLKSKRPYNLEVIVRGAVIILHVDGVEIGKYTLAAPSLPGQPCGIFCLGHNTIRFKNVLVEANQPKAFVVMQFQTAEYEALFRDVIDPICKAEGLYAYRADSTYLPGLIIEDIKEQISEARVIIAEITPQNPNVYYEVGYADALNKPIILISDRKEGLKPFGVRAYRTIFYDNSIGGKNQIENDLRTYIRGIMES